jgi:hypothetical protein
VKDRLFPVQGFAKFKYPVKPAGMDKDALLTYKIPSDDLKASDNYLAKSRQLKVRGHLLKLQLPAAEVAKKLYLRTNPHESPAALKAELMARFGTEEGADTRSAAEQYESCLLDYVSHLNVLLAQLTDRLTLGAHALLLHDYDLQTQRTTLVSTQTKALMQAAFGREEAHVFRSTRA